MTTLEDLKKRATASEAVLIERVEALVAGQAKADAKKRLLVAARSVPVPDAYSVGCRDEHPVMNWVDKVIRKIEES